MKKLMGLRSFKTILSVVIAYCIAEIFPALSPAMMSAAAITAINISMFESFRSSFNRVMSNIVAILLAFLLQAIGQVNPLGVFIGMSLLVMICSIFKWQYVIGNAAIFFVFVLEVPYANKNLEIYAFNRIMDTIIGSIIGLTVNTFVFRPRQEKYLLATYKKAYESLKYGFKDLIEEDKSVDEFALIDSISQINQDSKKLRRDVMIKMNENVNTVTVTKLNNLFRTALSLIIELNELDEYPIITKKNNEEMHIYFEKDFKCGFHVGEPETEFDKRYNYELAKLIDTLESIEYNLNEFIKMYNRAKDKWYLERKD